MPHLTGETVGGLGSGEPAGAAAVRARALSDALIAELRAADVIVIGAPMYNFGIPSTLKTWFDYVLRAGVTFRYTEAGAEGLLRDKRAIVVESRGGIYGEGAQRDMDAQEPHLRAQLGFIGITDVTFVRAEGLAMGSDAREQGIARAMGAIGRVPAHAARRAA